MNSIESVQLDPHYPGLILVIRADGSQIRYRDHDGTLYPGRPWISSAPDGHRVIFFIPFPDGTPEILSVEEPTSAST
jgi:hypothetical protein